MKRHEAIEAILFALNEDDIALFTTGMIGREAFSMKDRKKNLYMMGSMGLVSSVALGMALNRGNRIIVFDGDGSILMDLGTMAMIADQRPHNLIHIILDNETYESTGGQPTISKDTNLTSVADAIGYPRSYFAKDISSMKGFLKEVLESSGPTFVHVKVEDGRLPEIPRVSHTPVVLKERFQCAL